MAVINSTNMNLPIPQVGVETGPQWATDINSCMTILDGHNHTTGYGVQIPPGGININDDLSFQSNNATLMRSVRFAPQVTPLAGFADLGCIFESGIDLYYRDGAGNLIRITQSGGVAGSPGSISNLVSPASASYVSASQSFVWQQAANTAANIDCASVLLRNTTANSKALTLAPPLAMGSNYSITLPSLPPAQQFVTLDNSGNMAAPYSVDGSTIQVQSNIIKVPTAGITATQLATDSVTTVKIADQNVTTAKIADSNVTTVKILDGNVTSSKLQSGISLPSNATLASYQFITGPSPYQIVQISWPGYSGAGFSIPGTNCNMTGDGNLQVGTLTFNAAFWSTTPQILAITGIGFNYGTDFVFSAISTGGFNYQSLTGPQTMPGWIGWFIGNR